MHEWSKKIQVIIDIIDICIRKNADTELSLNYLAEMLGYSEYYVSRKFNYTARMIGKIIV